MNVFSSQLFSLAKQRAAAANECKDYSQVKPGSLKVKTSESKIMTFFSVEFDIKPGCHNLQFHTCSPIFFQSSRGKEFISVFKLLDCGGFLNLYGGGDNLKQTHTLVVVCTAL